MCVIRNSKSKCMSFFSKPAVRASGCLTRVRLLDHHHSLHSLCSKFYYALPLIIAHFSLIDHAGFALCPHSDYNDNSFWSILVGQRFPWVLQTKLKAFVRILPTLRGRRGNAWAPSLHLPRHGNPKTLNPRRPSSTAERHGGVRREVQKSPGRSLADTWFRRTRKTWDKSNCHDEKHQQIIGGSCKKTNRRDVVVVVFLHARLVWRNGSSSKSGSQGKRMAGSRNAVRCS